MADLPNLPAPAQTDALPDLPKREAPKPEGTLSKLADLYDVAVGQYVDPAKAAAYVGKSLASGTVGGGVDIIRHLPGVPRDLGESFMKAITPDAPGSKRAQEYAKTTMVPFELVGSAVQAVSDYMGRESEREWKLTLDSVFKSYQQLTGTQETDFQKHYVNSFSNQMGGLAYATTMAAAMVGPAKMGSAAKAIASPVKLATRAAKATSYFIDSIAKKGGTKPSEVFFTRDGDLKMGQSLAVMQKRAFDALKLTPDQQRDVIFNLEGDKSIQLNPTQQQAAAMWRSLADELADAEQRAGVLGTVLNDYVTHVFDLSPKSQGTILDSLINKIYGQGAKGKSASTRLRYAKERTIRLPLQAIMSDPAYAYLKPELDLGRLAFLRVRASAMAMANKKLVSGLATIEGVNGKKLLIPTGRRAAIQAPYGPPPASYKFLSHPSISGYAIHPDLLPALKFIYDEGPSFAGRALLALNFAAKRIQVSLSLFHPRALVDVYLGAMGHKANPFEAARMWKSYWRGQLGKSADDVISGGLEIGGVEDVGGSDFYKGMEDIAELADRYTYGILGSVPRSYEWLMKKMDSFMWDHLHTGMKLQVAIKSYEKLLLDFPAEDPKVLARSAAQYTNSLFGGLNWMQLALTAKTKIGYHLFSDLYSPKGRRILQVLVFAPDWTISTTRSMLQAIPGMAKDKYAGILHRAYVYRSALYYFFISNTINQHFTGHGIAENEDPTMVELGDGRHMLLSKHFVEAFRWLLYPGQEALNKMGVVPSELLEQALNQKWLSTKHAPPIVKKGAGGVENASSRIQHLLSRALPFSVSQGLESDSIEGLLSSIFGSPIYGRTTEEQEAKKFEKSLAPPTGNLTELK